MVNMDGHIPVRLVNDFNAEETWVRLDPEPIAKALGLPVEYTDTEGYKVEVIAGAIHPDKNWIAWVKRKAKETVNERGNFWLDIDYFLTISRNGSETFSWVLQSYNPYFGCWIRYLEWYGDKVVCIYFEKHHTYGCTIWEAREVNFVQLGHDGAPVTVKNGIAMVLNEIPFSKPPELQRYKLPDWTPLATFNLEKALEQGVVTYPPKSNEDTTE